MARKIPTDSETPEQRQRREALEALAASGQADEGVARGRGGIPQGQHSYPQFRQPTTRPQFHPPPQDSGIIHPPPQFADYTPPQGFRQIVDPITGEIISYSIEQSGEMDTPPPSTSRRRRHRAGDQSAEPYGFTQSIEPLPGGPIPLSAEPTNRFVIEPIDLDEDRISQPGTSRRRRHTAGDQSAVPQGFTQTIDPVTGEPISYSIEPTRRFVIEPIDLDEDRITQPRTFRTMAERFRDPTTGKPDWKAMKNAIAEENRFKSGQPLSAEQYGKAFAEKSKAELLAEKEYRNERPQRQVDELLSRGYYGLKTVGQTPPRSARWTRATPSFDPNERRKLWPQISGAAGRPQLRRTMSSPDLSGRDPSMSWTSAMRDRKVYNKSHFLQNELDQRRVKQMSRVKNFAIRRNLNRQERRTVVSAKAKMDVVVKVEDLSLEIHSIPEENEELNDVCHPYKMFQNEDDDDSPDHDDISFVR